MKLLVYVVRSGSANEAIAAARFDVHLAVALGQSPSAAMKKCLEIARRFKWPFARTETLRSRILWPQDPHGHHRQDAQPLPGVMDRALRRAADTFGAEDRDELPGRSSAVRRLLAGQTARAIIETTMQLSRTPVVDEAARSALRHVQLALCVAQENIYADRDLLRMWASYGSDADATPTVAEAGTESLQIVLDQLERDRDRLAVDGPYGMPGGHHVFAGLSKAVIADGAKSRLLERQRELIEWGLASLHGNELEDAASMWSALLRSAVTSRDKTAAMNAIVSRAA
jgi:hypothetical protein